MLNKYNIKILILGLTLFLGCSFSPYKKSLKKGLKHFNKGNYEIAVKYFSLALNVNPDYKQARLWRAKSFVKLKEFEKAIKDCSVFIKSTEKTDLKVYLLRGEAFLLAKKYKKALGDYNQAIELDFKNSKAYHKRGLLYVKIEAFKRAKSDLKHAVKLDPSNEKIYCDLGKYYLFRKQYKKAIQNLKKAVEIQKNYAIAHYFLGRAYLGGRNKSKAFDQCTILNKLNPKLKNKLFNIYLKLDKDSVFEKRKI
jgi:tetratricopeptide (TPR) repeat protein